MATCTERARPRRWLLGLSTAVALGLALVAMGVPVQTSMAQTNGTVTGSLKAKKSRYRKNAVVYLKGTNAKARPAKSPVKMDQRNHEFLPRVLPVTRGTTVRFLNSDNEAHNVFSPDNEGYDLGNWGLNEHRDRKFGKAGIYTQLCRLHPSMIGYVVVLDTPFFTTTREDGAFEIKNVPPGTYEVHVWHERAKSKPQKVTVGGGGSVTVELPMKRGRS